MRDRSTRRRSAHASCAGLVRLVRLLFVSRLAESNAVRRTITMPETSAQREEAVVAALAAIGREL